MAPFGPAALLGLDEFSHVEVIYLFDRVDPATVHIGSRVPRDNPAWPEVGILAQRAKNRPNRLGLATCALVAVTGAAMLVRGLDAIDGTPVIDIKPYMTEFAPRARHATGVVARAHGRLLLSSTNHRGDERTAPQVDPDSSQLRAQRSDAPIGRRDRPLGRHFYQFRGHRSAEQRPLNGLGLCHRSRGSPQIASGATIGTRRQGRGRAVRPWTPRSGSARRRACLSADSTLAEPFVSALPFVQFQVVAAQRPLRATA